MSTKIALVQQHATGDKAANIERGLAAFQQAARAGAQGVAFAELAFEPFYPQVPASARSIDRAEPVIDGESFVCAPDGNVIARAGLGTDEILCADLDFTKNAASHARTLFLRDRRPELYGEWLSR